MAGAAGEKVGAQETPVKLKGKMWQWPESERTGRSLSVWAQLGRRHRDKYHRDTGPSRQRSSCSLGVMCHYHDSGGTCGLIYLLVYLNSETTENSKIWHFPRKILALT